MTGALQRRLAAVTGLVLAGAVALWWLGSTRIALMRGADASRCAGEALLALWLLRGMALAVAGPRLGALAGWRQGAGAMLALLAPAWPLLVLAWSASRVSPWQVLLAELLLVAGGLLLPPLGQALRRLPWPVAAAELAATTLGLGLALALWTTRGWWPAAPV